MDLHVDAGGGIIQTLEAVMTHVGSFRRFEDEMRGLAVVVERSPVGDPQANGTAEDAIRRLQWQIGIVKLVGEHHFGGKVDMSPYRHYVE